MGGGRGKQGFWVHLTVEPTELHDELIRCECDGKQEIMGDFGDF